MHASVSKSPKSPPAKLRGRWLRLVRRRVSAVEDALYRIVNDHVRAHGRDAVVPLDADVIDAITSTLLPEEYGEPPAPALATYQRPGTPGKLAVMQARAGLRLDQDEGPGPLGLSHPGDEAPPVDLSRYEGFAVAAGGCRGCLRCYRRKEASRVRPDAAREGGAA